MRGSRGIYEIITAKALVTNVRNALTMHKRPGQIHLQTWHGCGAVKLVEKQIEHKLSPTYLAGAKRDGQIADGILVANSAQENLFKEFFWLADSVELLRTGLPRNDAIIKYKNDTEYLTKVRSRLGISADKYFV